MGLFAVGNIESSPCVECEANVAGLVAAESSCKSIYVRF